MSYDSCQEDETLLPCPTNATKNPDTGIPRELFSRGESNESILDPCKEGRQKEEIPGGNDDSAQRPGLSSRKRSAFEIMMASLEKPSVAEKRATENKGKDEMANDIQ